MVERTPNDVRDTHTLDAQRYAFMQTTMVSKQFDWHYAHFTSSQCCGVNKLSMFWSSPRHIIWITDNKYGLLIQITCKMKLTNNQVVLELFTFLPVFPHRIWVIKKADNFKYKLTMSKNNNYR